MPDPTIPELLSRQAQAYPDRCFLRFDALELTFADVDRWSSGLADHFRSVGIGKGDLVPLMMPNVPEFVVSWFALCKLGAVTTMINTAMRGPVLARALDLSQSDIVIADASLLDGVRAVRGDLTTITRAMVLGQETRAGETAVGENGLEVLPFPPRDRLGTSNSHSPHVVDAHDAAMVMFTSGTTGRSKGCLLSHRYAVRQSELMVAQLGLREDDVLYCPFPLFHLDGSVLTVMPALVLGATAAIGERFSVSRFWGDIARFGATVFDFMGATLTMLYKAPAAPSDAHNTVRLAWGVPVPEFAEAFEQRFALRLVELYGSTDAGVPIYQPIDEPRRPGSCGRVVAAYEVQLFDEDDRPVEIGAVGEIVIRPNEPSIMSDGYFGMPEATLAASRNLWFHTGDLAKQDADGWIYYVGRRAESIRRRGENISSFEIEEVLKLHPDILDAAAYGVPSELTEDDVMVAVVTRPSAALDPADLIEFCRERMARHMLPRYVEFVESLPRTQTEKVEKQTLIARGVGSRTWDRERSTHQCARDQLIE
jgi:crotonobetaine/carnitine-CoA ligase